MRDHREVLSSLLDRLVIEQPSYETMAAANESDVRDPRAFFEDLELPARVRGLPACLAPGANIVGDRRILRRELFDPQSGRLAIRPLARYHVAERYRAKSLRCTDCALDARCEGAHINLIRDQGLGLLTPLSAEQAASVLAPASARLASGRPPEPVAASLPGFPPPQTAPLDPLAVAGRERDRRRAERRRLPVL
jgi:hypothetical protein